MRFPNRIARALPVFAILLAGCRGGGFSSPASTPTQVSVTPPSSIVTAGTTIAFTASFTPSPPLGGSLTWSVNPPGAGTITASGVYVASGNAGSYTVVATWTPNSPSSGTKMSATAAVQIVPVPQVGIQLNPNFVQASGGNQSGGAIQNGAIAGQMLPSVTSTDASSNVQTRSGLNIPPVCKDSSTNCQ